MTRTWWSAGMAALMGIPTAGPLSGHTLAQVIDPLDLAVLTAFQEDLARSEDARECLVRVRLPDGQVAWRSIRGRRKGRLVSGIALDSDELIRRRSGIRDLETQLAQAWPGSALVPWTWDLDTDEIGTAVLPGETAPGSADEITGLLRSMAGDDPAIGGVLAAQATTGVPFHVVHQFPDGRALLLRGLGIRDAAGTVHRLAGVCVDVTADAADQATAGRDARLRRMLDAPGGGSWWTDASRILRASPSGAILLGLNGTPVTWPDYVASQVHIEDQAALTEGASSPGEQPVVRTDFRVRGTGDQYRWVRSTGRWDEGEYQAMVEDIDAARGDAAQVALRLEELEFTLQATGTGTWLAELKDGVLVRNSWSPPMYDLFYVAPGTPLGPTPMSDVMHPDDVARMDAFRERAIASGELESVDVRIPDPAGEWRWRRVRARYAPAGSTTGRFLGVAIDVDAAVKAERALEELSTTLTVANRAALLRPWVWDLDSDQIFVPTSLDVPGTIAIPDSGRQIDEQVDLMALADPGGLHDHLAEARITGTVDVEYALTDGQWLLSRGTRTTDPVTGRPRIVGFTMNVTAQKEAALEAIRLRAELEAILETTSVGVWQDLGAGRMALSPGARALLGITQPELDWDTFVATHLHPDDRATFRGVAGRPAGTRPARVEFRVRRPDGPWRWLRSTMATPSAGQPRPTGVLVDIDDERKAAAQATQALADLDLVLTSTRTGTWTSSPFQDPETVSFTWSPSMYRLFDLPVGAVITQAVMDGQIHPDDVERMHVWGAGLMDSGTLGTIDLRARMADGTWAWRSFWAQYSNPGQLGGQFRGVCIDRHDAITAQENLLLALEQIRAASEVARMRTWVWDLETDLVRAPTFIAVAGTPYLGAEPVPIDVLNEDVDMADLQPLRDATARARETGEFDFTYRSRDGEWLLCRGRATIDPVTGKRLIIGCVINITDERQAVDEADQLRRSLEQILAATEVGIWQQDTPEFLTLSPSAARLLGTADRISLETLRRDVIHPDDLPQVTDSIVRAIGGEQTGTLEFRVRRTDGTWRWLRSVLATGLGNAGTTGVLVDIDPEKQAQLQAQQALDELSFVLTSMRLGAWTSGPFAGDATEFTVSSGVPELFGLPTDRPIRWADVMERWHPDDLVRARAWTAELMRSGELSSLEIRARMPDGSWHWRTLWSQYSPAGAPDGRFRGIALDQDAVIRNRLRLEEISSLLQAATDVARMAAWSVDVAAGTIEVLDPGLGPDGFPAITEAAPVGQVLQQVLGVDNPERPSLEADLLAGHAVDRELQQWDGRWVRVRGEPRTMASGEHRVVGVSLDITARRELEQRTLALERRFRSTLDALDLAAVILDPAGMVTYLNPAMLAWSGVALEQVAGVDFCAAFLPACIRGRARHQLRSWLAGDTPPAAVPGFLDPAAGAPRYVVWNVYPIQEMVDGGRGIALIGRDATQERLALRQLQQQQQRDTLTGLWNRSRLERAMTARLRTSPDPEQTAVILADLDQTAQINELGGFAAGDSVLQAIAGIIRSRFPNDVAARVGGDEFAILLSGTRAGAAEELAEELRHDIAGLRVDVGETAPLSVRSSMGVALASGAGVGENLVSQAEAAVTMAKAGGRNRTVRFDPATMGTQALSAATIGALVQEALDHDALRVLFQPIVSTAGRPPWVEALTRIPAQDGSLLTPDVFIPVAEASGLMEDLDQAIISQALRQCQAHGLPERGIGCHVNASHYTLREAAFARWLDQLLETTGYPPELLLLEVTETAAVANLPALRSTLHRVRELGVRIGLDDFGVGLSSFALMAELPVDTIKIDGSFVQDMDASPVHYAMVRAIADVAHAAGKETVAEFVESDAVLQALQILGVDYAQGYLLGKPVPLEDLDLGLG